MAERLEERVRHTIGWDFAADETRPIPPQRNVASVIVVHHGIVHEDAEGAERWWHFSVLARQLIERAPLRARRKLGGALGAGAEIMTTSKDERRTARDLKVNGGSQFARELSAALQADRTAPDFDLAEAQSRIRSFEERQERLWNAKAKTL